MKYFNIAILEGEVESIDNCREALYIKIINENEIFSCKILNKKLRKIIKYLKEKKRILVSGKLSEDGFVEIKEIKFLN